MSVAKDGKAAKKERSAFGGRAMKLKQEHIHPLGATNKRQNKSGEP